MKTQDDVREFILAKSKNVPDSKGALATWSRALGLNHAYLYQFINKRSPAKLSEDVREKLAVVMGVDEEELRAGDKKLLSAKSIMSPNKHKSGEGGTLGHNARIGNTVTGFTRVPIRGQSMGGKDGALIFNPDEYFGDVEAPPKLQGIPDAYAVYVIGESMLERYQHGEIVYVHPYAPVKKDDYVVVQVSTGNGEPVHGWVKRFVSRDDRSLKVQQLNPKKIISFPINRVVAVHKIIMGGSE